MDVRGIQQRLRDLGNPQAAAFAARFFRTGPGEYGEGDVFLGIRVGPLRKLATEHRSLPLAGVSALLRSPIHEDRTVALLILTHQFLRAEAAGRRKIFELYRKQIKSINNWDLVDLSAPVIVGGYLADRDRGLLDELAGSSSLWERRIAIVATLHFIRRGELIDTLRLAEALLGDREDLIHKASGWMLREVGKRDVQALTGWLDRHALAMPRTMLRYAIERFPEPQRLAYLKGSRRV